MSNPPASLLLVLCNLVRNCVPEREWTQRPVLDFPKRNELQLAACRYPGPSLLTKFDQADHCEAVVREPLTLEVHLIACEDHLADPGSAARQEQH